MITGIAVVVVLVDDPISLGGTKISKVSSVLKNDEVKLTDLTAVSATRSHYAS